MRNRTQIMLFAIGTAILTAMIVAGATLWLDRPTVLKIAVGAEGGPEQRFADHLGTLLAQNRASIRLTVLTHDNSGQVAARFARREADLAIIRTDSKIPAHARAVAVLEREMLLLIAPKASKLRAVADLKGKRLAVLGEDGRNEALVRQVLGLYEINLAKTKTTVQTVPPASSVDRLLAPGGFDLVIAIEPLSSIAKTSTFEDLAQRMGGFTLLGVSESKALERKIPGLTAETIDAGLLAGSPRIPDDDLNTLGVQKLLVARAKLSDPKVIDLMRVLFENKGDLAVDQRFATNIEPPDVEKDAAIGAHDGAVQYVDGEVKTFVDRYSDLIYLTMSVGSIVGSLGLALFTSMTRVRPRKASARAGDLLAVRDAVRVARSPAELDIAETELEDILDEILRGLQDGTVSSSGLDGFRLGYEHAREALVERRRSLPPQPPSPTKA